MKYLTIILLFIGLLTYGQDLHYDCYSERYVDSVNALAVEPSQDSITWKDNYVFTLKDGTQTHLLIKDGFDFSFTFTDTNNVVLDISYVGGVLNGISDPDLQSKNDSLLTRIAFLESVMNNPIKDIYVIDSLNLNIYNRGDNIKVNILQEDTQKRWCLWIDDETEIRVGQGNEQDKTWLPERRIIKY